MHTYMHAYIHTYKHMIPGKNSSHMWRALQIASSETGTRQGWLNISEYLK